MPSSAMRESQIFFCSGVATTAMGSLPRKVASNDVGTPRLMRAISSHTRYTSNAPPPNPPYSSGMNSSWMPSLSGLHICRTISMGHSSRSSSSIRVWSGNRFLAKSRSDFKLSFKVLLVIMGSFLSVLQFLHAAGHFRQKLQDVVHNPDIRHTEYGRLRILVDGHDKRTALQPGQMLERTA